MFNRISLNVLKANASRRYISQTTAVYKNNVGGSEEISAPTPTEVASSSPIENKPEEYKQMKIRKKRPFLSKSIYENPNYKLPYWKEAIGEFVIGAFHLDMDRIRAGPVAGSIYYGKCKAQGLQYPDEELSETAKFYYETLGLPRTFSQWFQITALHQWILATRMRALPFKYGRNYQQKIVDRFFRDMELRLADEMGVHSNRIIEGYLKDFHAQLRGLVVSYDQALVTDDATMASALWRNLFSGRPDVDYTHLEAMVGYVRSQLYLLDKISDREFAFGEFDFASPYVAIKPFTKAEEEKLRQQSIEKFTSKEGEYIKPSKRSILAIDN